MHKEIAESGESPGRLAVLTRAYANLGDATRHVLTGQSNAFFARSLVYRTRLLRLAPKDPIAWWSAGYGAALYGVHRKAEELIEHGDTLAKASNQPAPEWVELTRDLILFRTDRLSAKSKQPGAGSLASYFAWLTVEHATLPSIAINAARTVVDQNPAAIRAYDSISGNAGVGLLHQTTTQAPVMLNRVVARLAGEPLATEPVRAAAAKAKQDGFAVPAILELLETLDRQPGEPGQLLPWYVYASIVRECQYVNATRRLFFVCHQWSVDPSGDFEQWWPVVKGHRYAALFETFNQRDGNPPAAAVEKVRSLRFKDDGLSAYPLSLQLQLIGVNEHPQVKTHWVARYLDQSDRTAYTYANWVWLYRFAESDPADEFNEFVTISIFSLSGHHPFGDPVLVVADRRFTTRPAKDIEATLPANPLVAYTLGKAYLNAKRYDDAKRLLERVAADAPDKVVYTDLAAIDLAKKDEDAWVATWDRYLQQSEDFGLDHAGVCNEVANRLILRHKPEQALPYAERSAQSYSAFGLQVYAHVLTLLHRYDEAAKVLEADFERYGKPSLYYFWSRDTGHGNVAVAGPAMRAKIATDEKSDDTEVLTNAGIYYYLEGKSDRALELWESGAAKDNLFHSVIAAVVRLESNNAELARRLVDGGLSRKADNPYREAYHSALKELSRCLNDADAVPARDGDIGRILNDPDLLWQRLYISCAFGKLSEVRGKTEDAKWWYGTCLDTPILEATPRAIAAEALRKLGVEYYK